MLQKVALANDPALVQGVLGLALFGRFGERLEISRRQFARLDTC